MEDAIEIPQQPEPLTILRKLRRFNLTMWAGGYADQPWILMAELNAVIEAEITQKNIELENELLRLRTKQMTGQT